MMVPIGIPCRLAEDTDADLVLCDLNAISTPALVKISFTHLDIVLSDTGPNGLLVLISSFLVVLMSLVRSK